MVIKTKEEFDALVSNPRKYIKYGKKGLLTIEYNYSDKYDVLVKALNISGKKERITYIYDSACEKIDKFNEEKGIVCSFENGKCTLYGEKGKVNGCCYHCKYQSSTGCPTKNVTCKLFFCKRLEEKKPATFQDFPEFKLLTPTQQEIIKSNPYCYREVFIKLLCLNSYILFCLYSMKKPFEMSVAENKNRKLEN